MNLYSEYCNFSISLKWFDLCLLANCYKVALENQFGKEPCGVCSHLLLRIVLRGIAPKAELFSLGLIPRTGKEACHSCGETHLLIIIGEQQRERGQRVPSQAHRS